MIELPPRRAARTAQALRKFAPDGVHRNRRVSTNQTAGNADRRKYAELISESPRSASGRQRPTLVHHAENLHVGHLTYSIFWRKLLAPCATKVSKAMIFIYFYFSDGSICTQIDPCFLERTGHSSIRGNRASPGRHGGASSSSPAYLTQTKLFCASRYEIPWRNNDARLEPHA